MTGFALALLPPPVNISMLVAVALCVKSNGLETSKEIDFCGRRIRSGPPFEDDGLSASVDGCFDTGCESRVSWVAVENLVTGDDEVDWKGPPNDGGETFKGGREDGKEDPEGAGIRLTSESVSWQILSDRPPRRRKRAVAD